MLQTKTDKKVFLPAGLSRTSNNISIITIIHSDV